MEILNKNLDNIQYDYDLFGNRIDKLAMQERIGFLPISIWEPDWQITKQLKEVIGDDGETRVLDKKSKIYRKGGRYGATNNEREINRQSSIFNPHLAQMILSAYSPKNAKIYDPFAGGGTRALIAASMGHKYYGVELRESEVNRIIQQRELLGKNFHISVGDSRIFQYEEESFDFSYTCPPYFDLEIYSDMEEDMSAADDYYQFLSMLKESVRGVYKGLKKESLSVWVVGNFRDKRGNLTHFNGDLIKIGIECGFQLHDELIFWGASKAAAQRCGNFKANRRSVRVHEYIIIFKK